MEIEQGNQPCPGGSCESGDNAGVFRIDNRS